MPYLKLLALTALMAPAIAQARDLSGDYGGSCDGAVQCAVEITNRTTVSVIVADRLDYSKKTCTVSGTLQDTPNGLAGTMKADMKVFVVSTPDGGIYLNGIPAKACGRNLNGYYTAIGD
ncbi:hypothetical protein [Neorhizobium sp. NCHU2750]|uniref:hypothetical protein n=1 Tax=Neorhizobium sp. NCHU2750 TaxID=1825976 RepID=UPI000EB6C4D1|nr:hypothetical protein NCHU2750_05210 [Neorhizobium sp. NCHU2750]